MTRQVALAVLLVATIAPLAAAQATGSQDSLEYPVKASLLLNFAKFAEWPAGSAQAASSNVAICVLGTDPFGSLLDSIVEGRRVGSRSIEVRRYREIQGIEACHVLFIASGEESRMLEIAARIGGSPVLTVGDSNGFAERGGVIGLSVEENRARFSVNLGPTEASGLKLSSKLLKVARSVRVEAGR